MAARARVTNSHKAFSEACLKRSTLVFIVCCGGARQTSTHSFEKIMKKIILLIASLLFMSSLPTTSFAHSFSHHSQFRPHGGVSFYYGPSWYYPPTFYYPPYGPAPIIVQRPAAPTVYIERNIAPIDQDTTTSQQSNYWYFCASSNTYYPYVRECAEPWQRVSPTPPQ